MTLLILATGNAHKVAEIRGFLPSSLCYLSLRDFPGAPAVVEDADSFAGNAFKKSIELTRWLSTAPAALHRALLASAPSRAFCLADDSGLEVDALLGAPGVHSARFAALDTGSPVNSPDTANNQKLLRLMAGVPSERRTARFRCCLAVTPVLFKGLDPVAGVCDADEGELRTELFEGTCEGQIDQTPQGFQGFGYDPLFIPAGFAQSFAELGPETKNQISHRARALARFRDWLGRAPES